MNECGIVLDMYKAINDNIIVTRNYQDKKTASGIILNETSEGQVFELEVVATTEITKELQGKKVFALRHKVAQLNESEGIIYGSLSYKDILAVK
jgi:co-chaperonin GroES (HSP10)